MWFCPECGNKNEDAFRFCSACGKEKPTIIDPETTVISETEKVQPEVKANKGNRQRMPVLNGIKLPVWAIAGAAVVVAVVLLLSLGVFTSASSLLKKADAAFDKEDYKSALSYYTKYADKAELSNKEKDKLLEDTRVALAEKAIDKEKWDDAAEYLEKCSSAEADELMERCNAGLAKEAIDDEDWDEARQLLEDCSAPEAEQLRAQCNYHFALEAIDEEDWETAAALLKDINYSDSEELLKECESKLGPDSAFLDALAEGIEKYLSADKSSFALRLSAVQEIQSRIDEYSGQTFFDANVGSLAELIISNIDSQAEKGEKAVAASIYYRSYQKSVWSSMIDLCGYLTELNANYGFLEGNSDFKKTFIDAKSTWESQLVDINTFDTDFSEYRSKYSASGWAGTQQFIKYVNNTGKYYKSITFFFDNYDKNKQYTRTSKTTMEVPEGQIRIYFDSDVTKEKYWDWDWYINFDN